jgi:hypothetical protein
MEDDDGELLTDWALVTQPYDRYTPSNVSVIIAVFPPLSFLWFLPHPLSLHSLTIFRTLADVALHDLLLSVKLQMGIDLATGKFKFSCHQRNMVF